MVSPKTNAIVDILSFIAFIPTAVSSFVFYFGGRTPTWSWMHKYFGFAFIGLMIIHLFLHLTWIKDLKQIFSSTQ